MGAIHDTATTKKNYAAAAMGSTVSTLASWLHLPPEGSHINEGMSQSAQGVTESETTRVDVKSRSDADGCTIDCKKAQNNSSATIQAFQDALDKRSYECEGRITENNILKRRVRKLYSKIEHKDSALAQTTDDAKLRYKFIDELLTKTIAPFAKQNGLTPKEWNFPSVMEVQESLARNAAEATALREQVQSLQKEMLAKVENTQTVSDEQFAQDFRTIVSQIKTLSRTVRLFAEVDTAAVLGRGILQDGVSPYHWQGRAKKKLLVEAWIWSVLLELVFGTPFMVYGADCNQLSSMWQTLYLTGHCNGWPTPTPLSETWRRTTIDTMLGRVDRELITTGEPKAARATLDRSVLHFRQQVLGIFETELSKISATIVTDKVIQILNNACALAVKMSLQKFRLQVTWPKVGSDYNQDMMKALPDSDGDDIEDGGKVAFVVNPGLTKWGDTHGKNFDCRYDIVPALVQLETGAGEGNSGISLI